MNPKVQLLAKVGGLLVAGVSLKLILDLYVSRKQEHADSLVEESDIVRAIGGHRATGNDDSGTEGQRLDIMTSLGSLYSIEEPAETERQVAKEGQKTVAGENIQSGQAKSLDITTSLDSMYIIEEPVGADSDKDHGKNKSTTKINKTSEGEHKPLDIAASLDSLYIIEVPAETKAASSHVIEENETGALQAKSTATGNSLKETKHVRINISTVDSSEDEADQVAIDIVSRSLAEAERQLLEEETKRKISVAVVDQLLQAQRDSVPVLLVSAASQEVIGDVDNNLTVVEQNLISASENEPVAQMSNPVTTEEVVDDEFMNLKDANETVLAEKSSKEEMATNLSESYSGNHDIPQSYSTRAEKVTHSDNGVEQSNNFKEPDSTSLEVPETSVPQEEIDENKMAASNKINNNVVLEAAPPYEDDNKANDGVLTLGEGSKDMTVSQRGEKETSEDMTSPEEITLGATENIVTLEDSEKEATEVVTTAEENMLEVSDESVTPGGNEEEASEGIVTLEQPALGANDDIVTQTEIEKENEGMAKPEESILELTDGMVVREEDEIEEGEGMVTLEEPTPGLNDDIVTQTGIAKESEGMATPEENTQGVSDDMITPEENGNEASEGMATLEENTLSVSEDMVTPPEGENEPSEATAMLEDGVSAELDNPTSQEDGRELSNGGETFRENTNEVNNEGMDTEVAGGMNMVPGNNKEQANDSMVTSKDFSERNGGDNSIKDDSTQLEDELSSVQHTDDPVSSEIIKSDVTDNHMSESEVNQDRLISEDNTQGNDKIEGDANASDAESSVIQDIKNLDNAELDDLVNQLNTQSANDERTPENFSHTETEENIATISDGKDIADESLSKDELEQVHVDSDIKSEIENQEEAEDSDSSVSEDATNAGGSDDENTVNDEVIKQEHLSDSSVLDNRDSEEDVQEEAKPAADDTNPE